MPIPPKALVSASCLLALLGCFATDPPAASPQQSRMELHVLDWSADPAEMDALPRWPLFHLTSSPAIADPESCVFLLEGPMDAELEDDLAQRPARAATLDRAIQFVHQADEEGIWLHPSAALVPGEYTLVLAGWAQDEAGGALTHGVTHAWSLRVDDGPDSGARVTATHPPDGSVNIGTNLEEVVVEFDGLLQAQADALWLESPQGLAHPADVRFAPCTSGDGVTCAMLRPRGRLIPGATYRLVVSAALEDKHGAPVGPFTASMHIAPTRDEQPPVLATLACAIDETASPLGCVMADDRSVQLRVDVSEPSTLRLDAAGSSTTARGGPGSVVLRLAPIDPASEIALTLTARDAAGNQITAIDAIETPPPLATLSIVEVLADPAGPEPHQEFVELLNFGDHPVDVWDMHLSDDPLKAGTVIERSLLVPPGKRLLLVPDRFDAADPLGVAPPPGAPRIAMGRALAGNGIANGGEALYLRDAEGRRLSVAPASPRPRRGVCLVRKGDDPRSGDSRLFAYDDNGSCTPGW